MISNTFQIFCNHEHIADVEFALHIEHASAHALVEEHGVFVGARHDDCLLFAVAAVAVVDEFGEKFSGNGFDVVERLCMNRGRHEYARGDCFAYFSGVVENSRVFALTCHFGKRVAVDGKTICVEHFRRKSRAVAVAYGWKLGDVAEED